MAVSTLVRQGEDKYTREAYARRQDEIYFHNKAMYERDEYKRRAEQAEAENEKLRKQIALLQAN